jgi:ankyrin repeat protein
VPETTQASAEASEELFEAITADDRSTVAMLLDRDPALANADHESGLSPLMMATYCRRPELADLLLERGAELDLFAAAARGEAERITALLAESPDLVGAHSPDGWTALHLAAHFGHAESVALLLINGADVSARSANALANTALHAALAGRHREVAELLLANGADVNATQHGGFTALHAAAQHGDLALVELLFAHGADPNAATDSGQTALTMADEKGHAAVVERIRATG